MSNDLKRLIASQQDEKQELINDLIESGTLKRRKRASKEETDHAYRYVLDTGESASEALTDVSRAYNKDDSWVDSIKHSPVYKNIIDYSIKNNKDHPIFQLMKKTGVWHTGTKKSLRESSTLSSLLNNLSKNVDITVRIAKLENLTELLIDHAILTDNQLKNIQEDIKELKKNNKQKALTLIKDGYNISEVSELTGVHRNTIRRWKDKN
jgi:DNA-binding transcriptional MerR regulator